jgi:hypothetical protein
LETAAVISAKIVARQATILAAFLFFAADSYAQTIPITRPPWDLSKLKTQPTHTFPCNSTGGTAALTACTLASYFNFSGSSLQISNFTGDSGSGGSPGLVPGPASGDAAAAKFLKADGTWATPAGGGGGTGTVNSGVAGKLAYYPSTAATVDDNPNASMTNGILSLGATSVLGGIDLLGGGSGTVSIRPQAAAGTYNYNLPTTAGTAGQPQLSGGGGSNPMTFGTLSVGGGGTGGTSFTSNALLKGAGSSPLTVSSITDDGSIISTSEPISTQTASTVTEVANSATGTTVNRLAKLTGAPATAIIITTSDSVGIEGVVQSGAGTTGNARIAVGGQVSCVFDGATTAGNYVQASTSSAGACHDAGSAYPTNGKQILGRVLSTNAAGGTFAMWVWSAGIVGQSSGTAGAGTTNPVTVLTGSTTTYTFLTSDCNTTIHSQRTVAITATVSNNLPVGCDIGVAQDNTNRVTIVPGFGATQNAPNGSQTTPSSLIGIHVYQNSGGAAANYDVIASGFQTFTATAGGTIPFTGLTGNSYEFHCRNLTISDSGATLQFQVGSGSTTWTTTDYYFAASSVQDNGVTGTIQGAGLGAFNLSSGNVLSASGGGFAQLGGHFYTYNSGVNVAISFQMQYASNAGHQISMSGGGQAIVAGGVVTAFRVLPSTGTINGQCGIREMF